MGRCYNIKTLKATLQKDSTIPYKTRVQSLNALGLQITAHEDEVLDALKKDLGKPALEAYLSEVYFVQREIKDTIKSLRSWMKPRKVSGVFFAWPSKSYVIYEPLGRVLIIAPWNYPFQLLLAPMVSAIAAGNSGILKPSEHTPHTNAVVKKILDRAIPDHLFTMADSHPDATRELLKERFDLIFFTGSTSFGMEVMKAASDHLTPVILELGGKSPCIVDRHLNVDTVAKRIIKNKLFNAGQTCVAPDYVCVHESEHASYVAAMERAIRGFFGDRPATHPDYTQIIHDGRVKQLLKLIHPSDGPISIGEHQVHDRRLAPTLLTKATWESPCMKEEIFGPILPILTYRELPNLFGSINRMGKPLSLYIFSNEGEFENECLGAVSSGNVCINDVMLQLTNPHLPFGGVGPSGMGRYHGKFGFEAFSNIRSIMKRSLRFAPFEMAPPYKNAFKNLRRFLK